MKSFEEFSAHFEQNVRKEIDALEAKRKAMFLWRVKLGGIGAGVVVLNLLFILWKVVIPETIFFTALVTPFVCYFVYIKHFVDKTIAPDYKEKVIKKMLNFLDPSLKYDAASHVSVEDWAASKLFPLKPDHYSGDDLISGKIDDIPLKISELVVMTRKPPGFAERVLRRKPKVPAFDVMFHGIFLVAEYPKTFRGRTFILPDRLQSSMSYTGRLVQENNTRYGAYINPRNYEFRRHFAVYADHELEGQALLTDELMQKMLILERRGKTKVYASLIGNKINVAVDLRKELFKIDLSKPLLNPTFVRDFYNEILYVFSIVDDLNIDEMELPSD